MSITIIVLLRVCGHGDDGALTHGPGAKTFVVLKTQAARGLERTMSAATAESQKIQPTRCLEEKMDELLLGLNNTRSWA